MSDTPLYLGLALTEQVSGNRLATELSNTLGYLRQQVVFDPTTGLNINAITFPPLARDVGSIQYLGIFTEIAANDRDLLVEVGVLETSLVGAAGFVITFAPGSIKMLGKHFVQPCPNEGDPQQTGITLSQDGQVLGVIRQLNIVGTLADASVSGGTGTLRPITLFTISSLSVSPSAGELGTPVTSVTLTWNFSGGSPTEITLNGQILDPALRTLTLIDLDLTAETQFSLVAKSGSKTAQKIVILKFQARVYWGVNSSDHLTDLSGLNSALKDSPSGDYSFGFGTQLYYYFAIPNTLNANSFIDKTNGNFPFSMSSPYLIDINGVSYKVYRSNRKLSYSNNITITVS